MMTRVIARGTITPATTAPLTPDCDVGAGCACVGDGDGGVDFGCGRVGDGDGGVNFGCGRVGDGGDSVGSGCARVGDDTEKKEVPASWYIS